MGVPAGLMDMVPVGVPSGKDLLSGLEGMVPVGVSSGKDLPSDLEGMVPVGVLSGRAWASSEGRMLARERTDHLQEEEGKRDWAYWEEEAMTAVVAVAFDSQTAALEFSAE